MPRTSGALVVVAALAGPALLAQDRPARFQSGVDLVSVTATVIDRDGHLVTGLPREAWERDALVFRFTAEVFGDGIVRPSSYS